MISHRRPETSGAAWTWQVCNSTGQRTPAIYQSNHCINPSHASHLPIISPRWANHPAYIAHRTRARTYKNAQDTAAHAAMDVRSRHRTNPRSTRFVLGEASEYRRRPRSYMWIRCPGGERLPTASYALRPKPDEIISVSYTHLTLPTKA